MGDKNIGKQKVFTARRDMPGITNLIADEKYHDSLNGISILSCITITPQTGVFLLALKELGAKISACSDNRFASDDDVVTYLRSAGAKVYAKSNMTIDEYYQAMDDAIAEVKDDERIQIADDGCDITQYIVKSHSHLFSKVSAITEQTTCGINFIKSLYKANKLPIPAININHCYTKQWFDNYLGIKQSIVHSFSKVGITISGKNISIFGYGPVGKGASEALRSQGANVSVVEADIIRLMQAEMDGFDTLSKEDALRKADICITASGCIDTISGEMIEKYASDGLLFVNVGHGTDEYSLRFLEENAVAERLDDYVTSYELKNGKNVLSLCNGALFNFIAGGGNPSKVMSLTFTLILLAHITIAREDISQIKPGLHSPARYLEVASVTYNFPELADKVYKLSENQRAYLNTP